MSSPAAVQIQPTVTAYSYSCLACPWRGPEPSWSDCSAIEVDPSRGQPERPHIAQCPQCGKTRIRCERVA